jgi:hypothetical protein
MKSLQTPRKWSTAKLRPSAFLAHHGSSNNHPAEKELEDFLFGRLPRYERKKIEFHLKGCFFCSETLIGLGDFIGSLRRAMGVHQLCLSWPSSWESAWPLDPARSTAD